MGFNFRKFFFYTKDLIKGNVIAKHIKDIELLYANPQSNESLFLINKRKSELLKNAVNNVPYYIKNSNISVENSIDSFPVVNKNIIKDNIDLFISKKFDKNKLIKVVTSGSTGTPFTVFHSPEKKARNTADTIFFGKLAGYEIGEQLNYFKIWTKVNRKSNFKSWLENINPVDVTQLSDTEIEKIVLNFKNNKSYSAILGYASALEAVCKFLDKNNPTTQIKRVKSIIAMSEGLNNYTKQSLLKYFGINAVSRYSNVENGIIAQQRNDGSSHFEINWASYNVEIFDIDSDKLVPLGEMGRIVVTDFFNHAMPLIRYDTGDIGVLNWDDSKQKIVLTKVEGRKMDMVFNTKGELVSSFTITNNMWLYPEIKQYQFIQLDKNKYMFKLNLDEGFNREESLVEEFKNYFGEDAVFSIEHVNEIPLLNSGKRKKVVNLYTS